MGLFRWLFHHHLISHHYRNQLNSKLHSGLRFDLQSLKNMGLLHSFRPQLQFHQLRHLHLYLDSTDLFRCLFHRHLISHHYHNLKYSKMHLELQFDLQIQRNMDLLRWYHQRFLVHLLLHHHHNLMLEHLYMELL